MPKSKITLFVGQELIDGLNILSKYTRVNKSEYIREGIQMVLEKYKKEVMLMDVGKVPFEEIVPTISRLEEEGKYDEAELFRKSVLREIKSLEKLNKKLKSKIRSMVKKES